MHPGIYPVFDKEFPGSFSAESGSVLLDENKELQALALSRGNPTLEGFLAHSRLKIPPRT